MEKLCCDWTDSMRLNYFKAHNSSDPFFFNKQHLDLRKKVYFAIASY